MRCENNLMETTLKKNMSLYEEDQQPEGGRWRKILRYVLIAVILAIVIQMLYAGVLFLLAWRAEGSLQTASGYKQIEKSFRRVIKHSKRWYHAMNFMRIRLSQILCQWHITVRWEV